MSKTTALEVLPSRDFTRELAKNDKISRSEQIRTSEFSIGRSLAGASRLVGSEVGDKTRRTSSINCRTYTPNPAIDCSNAMEPRDSYLHKALTYSFPSPA
jgi:hypothetical protein